MILVYGWNRHFIRWEARVYVYQTEGEGKIMLIAFDSTQQALRAEMLLEYADIDIDICPTPKEITAGCALSIHFPENALIQVIHVVDSENVEIRGIFQPIEGGYEEVAR